MISSLKTNLFLRTVTALFSYSSGAKLSQTSLIHHTCTHRTPCQNDRSCWSRPPKAGSDSRNDRKRGTRCTLQRTQCFCMSCCDDRLPCSFQESRLTPGRLSRYNFPASISATERIHWK